MRPLVALTALLVAAPCALAQPANDDFANAATIDADGDYTSSTEGATSEPDEAPASCPFGGPGDDSGQSVWWTFTPAQAATISLDTAESRTADGTRPLDTILTLHTGATLPVTEAECNDDDPTNGSGDFTSRLEGLAVDAGVTYHVRVSGYDNALGTGPVVLTVEGLAPGTAVEPGALPAGYAFSLVGANPFASATRFDLRVGEAQTVRVAAYDLAGREAAVLFEGAAAAGFSVPVTFARGGLAAGTYVVRATGETFDVVQRVTVLR